MYDVSINLVDLPEMVLFGEGVKYYLTERGFKTYIFT